MVAHPKIEPQLKSLILQRTRHKHTHVHYTVHKYNLHYTVHSMLQYYTVQGKQRVYVTLQHVHVCYIINGIVKYYIQLPEV